MCEECSVETLLIVGHGRWFQLYQRILHRQSIDDFLASYKTAQCPNGAIVVYDSFPDITEPEMIVPWQGKLQIQQTHLA
jgi:hypothetical protein